MTDKEKLDMLKVAINRKREIEELKKGVNEEIKANSLEIEETIMNSGDIEHCRQLYIKDTELHKNRKIHNAEIKEIGAKIE